MRKKIRYMKELTCIRCPMGCQISVEMKDGEITSITGNTCGRGKSYAQKEMTYPTRTVTTVLPVSSGSSPMVSVKTREDIPKDKVREAMKELSAIKVSAPIHIGDVLLKNIAGTNVDIVATKNVMLL